MKFIAVFILLALSYTLGRTSRDRDISYLESAHTELYANLVEDYESLILELRTDLDRERKNKNE